MSLSIGQRVTLNVSKSTQFPGEASYNDRTGVIEDLTSNPWFPVLVLIDGSERPVYFREYEVEPIGEGEDA